jgi:hypothetical protein
MNANEEVLDKLFDGRPVYSERRFEVFHEAAEALGITVIIENGVPTIRLAPENQKEIMAKLPRLKYKTTNIVGGYQVKPL